MNWQEIAGSVVNALRNAGVKKDVIDLQEKQVAIFRDEVAVLTRKLEVSESEKANLEVKIAGLKEELKRFSPTEEVIDPKADMMLIFLFDHGDFTIENLAQTLGIQRAMGEYHRDVLVRLGLIEQTGVGFQGFGAMGDWVDTSGRYGLTTKGREYVVRKRQQ